MKDLSKKVIEAIETYQVPGCVNDYQRENIVQNGPGVEWLEHVAGTMVFPTVGKFFLGMPVGFCRVGVFDEMPINIFTSMEQLNSVWKYDKFNIPCWKYLDKHGNTLVRGLSPRVNKPFLHIILGDNRAAIDCLEITNNDLKEMN